MPLRGTCLRRCRFRNVSPLGCYPMDEVPPAVTDERTMMAAATAEDPFVPPKACATNKRNEGVGSTDRHKIRGRRGSASTLA
jgi:hypothetical protein